MPIMHETRSEGVLFEATLTATARCGFPSTSLLAFVSGVLTANMGMVTGERASVAVRLHSSEDGYDQNRGALSMKGELQSPGERCLSA